MNQKGFASIAAIVLAVLVLGAVGYFAFVKNGEQTPPLINEAFSESEILAYIKNNWNTIQASISFRPTYHNQIENAQGVWRVPSAVQFIGDGDVLVRFEDDNRVFSAALNFDGDAFNLLEIFKDQGNFELLDWQNLVKKYGDTNYSVSTYTIALVRNGQGVRFEELTRVPENVFLKNYWEDLSTPAPTLTYIQGERPFIQINFDWSVADTFNIYRSINELDSYQKIISDLPASTHTVVDYDFPKDIAVLYYKIAPINKNGKEGSYSAVANIKIDKHGDLSSWKIYRNDALGFEFKYPPEWVIKYPREEFQEPPLYPEKMYIFSLSLTSVNLTQVQTESLRTEDLSIGFKMLDSKSWRLANIKERSCAPDDSKCVTKYKTTNGIEMMIRTFERAEGVYSGKVERYIEFKDGLGRAYMFHGRLNDTRESVLTLSAKRLYMDSVAESFRFLEN